MKQTFEAVPVSEALPEKEGDYHVIIIGELTDVAHYNNNAVGTWWSDYNGVTLHTVTHWLRPSPSPTEITQEMPQVVKYLLGESELDGHWFGEGYPGEAPFWWRSKLREAFSGVREQGWISVKEKAPNEEQEVLFSNTEIKDLSGNKVEPKISFGWYRHGSFHTYISGERMSATHWLPLPPVVK